jgi:hypothetical protein
MHLLVQAISIDRQGYLMDPCYTNLFHLPEENTSKSRNSFFCTIKTGEQKTELFLVSQRALTLFSSELKTIISGIHTLVFVVGAFTPAQADQAISDLIARQDSKFVPIGRLLVISHGTHSLTPQQLPQTQKWIAPQHIFCQSLPLLSAFEDLQHGQISPPTESLLKALTETIAPILPTP